MFCEKCGNQIDDNSMFCPFCGAKVEPLEGETGAVQQIEQPVQQFQQPVQQPLQQEPAQQYFQQQPVRQSPKANKGNKGLVIGIICGAAALCIILVLLFVFDVFGLRDSDDDSDDRAEKKTEVEADDNDDKNDVATVGEASTEATEATPAEPEQQGYGAQMGYVFSEPSAAGVKQAGYPIIYDSNGDKMDIDCTQYMMNYGYEEGIDYIAVTDPDENGNVTYIVKTHYFLESDFDFSDFPEGVDSITWSFNGWRYDISDYYTGTIIGYTTAKKGGSVETEKKEFECNGKNVSVTFNRYMVADNGEDMAHNDSTGLSHDYYTRNYYYFITVPQDYDGLVLSAPKTYDHATTLAYEDDPNVPEDVNEETAPLMDIKYYGYTSVDDTVFVRLSDQAVPYTADIETKVVNSYEQTGFNTFSWYLNNLDEKKDGDADVSSYNSVAGKITDTARLSGDWQGLVVWDPNHKVDCYEREYSNVSISTSGSNVSMTFKYRYSVDYGNNWTDISDRSSNLYSADMKEDGSIDFQPNGMAFTIDYFWSDGIFQYAFGDMMLPDGTEGKVVLQRP